MERTEFDALVLETPESLFKSIDVGMERGVKRHVAGWGLPRNGATLDQKSRHLNAERLSEIYRGSPRALTARAGVQKATAPHHHPAPVVVGLSPRFPFATKNQNE